MARRYSSSSPSEIASAKTAFNKGKRKLMPKEAVDFVIQYLWDCSACGESNTEGSMPRKGEEVVCQSCGAMFCVGEVIEYC